MGRGSRSLRRWRGDRQRKKKMRKALQRAAQVDARKRAAQTLPRTEKHPIA